MGVGGLRIPQNCTELRINTEQNKIKKTSNRIEISGKFLNTANRLVLSTTVMACLGRQSNGVCPLSEANARRWLRKKAVGIRHNF